MKGIASVEPIWYDFLQSIRAKTWLLKLLKI